MDEAPLVGVNLGPLPAMGTTDSVVAASATAASDTLDFVPDTLPPELEMVPETQQIESMGNNRFLCARCGLVHKDRED